ncbi:putative F-box protein At3g16210 [Trifolium pratense]|uniref:putative F-box protein At3g16210 n=1 Tax=Trifolium pratense TaxID=57577 RepID=UPI001E69544D|nr:putative F-box protein At3g16210 [Trifolium pratense]
MEKTTLAATKEEVSTYIPDDIVFFILSKLPLKSIKRFECVRKSWSLLFENHSFMNMFRNNCLASSHRCSYYDGASLLLTVYKPRASYYLSDDRFQNKVKLDWSHLFENQNNLPETLNSFGSINGTICFHDQGRFGKTVLWNWNPATHTFKILPLSPLIESSLPNVDFFRVQVITDIHGFGYDNLTNDYKIIRYVSITVEHRYYRNCIFNEYLNPFWEIYSLRSNSWKELDVCVPSSYQTKRTQVYMDHVCH